ncbi:hypothetical protein B0H14DRAFT_3462698 [Mycena olivaceomarginata]|nr:hypothetical protein B0H14DRAFT_3462698 [Mycena olivaceomarginata]
MSSSPKSSVCMIGWIASSMATLQPLPPRGIPGDWPGTAPTGLYVHQPLPLPLPSLPLATPAYHLLTPFLWRRTPPDRYVCTLVVPDVVVGHIVGRGRKGLHQAHDVSSAQLQAYTDKASPAERRCFMWKCVRAKKKGLSRPSEDPAPPPAGPVPTPPRAAMDVDPPPRRQTHPPAPGRLAQDLHPMMTGAFDPPL